MKTVEGLRLDDGRSPSCSQLMTFSGHDSIEVGSKPSQTNYKVLVIEFKEPRPGFTD